MANCALREFHYLHCGLLGYDTECSALKMYAEGSSKTLVPSYQTTRCHNSEDYSTSLHRRQNFRSQTLYCGRSIQLVKVHEYSRAGVLSGNALDSYSGRAWFESWPGHRLSWPRFFLFLLVPPRKCRVRPRPLPSKSVHIICCLPIRRYIVQLLKALLTL
jgi:hypothetical protein